MADMVDDNKKIDINMEIQFGERVSHRCWLIGPDPKLTRHAHLLSFASLFLWKSKESFGGLAFSLIIQKVCGHAGRQQQVSSRQNLTNNLLLSSLS